MKSNLFFKNRLPWGDFYVGIAVIGFLKNIPLVKMYFNPAKK